MTFNRKAYMQEYFKKYRERPEVKAKRKIEAKENYKLQKYKTELKRKLEKSKEQTLNQQNNFVKYVRKDLDLKYLREGSKESKDHNKTHWTILFDSCDYALLLIISKRPNLQIHELSLVIGLAQVNLKNHLKKLIMFNLVSISKEIRGVNVRRRWTKIYNITENGILLLDKFGCSMKEYIMKTNQERIEFYHRNQARQMLLEVLKND